MGGVGIMSAAANPHQLLLLLAEVMLTMIF
jgi:hypothetical protein